MSAQHHGEGVAATIGIVDFLDFNCVIGQIVVQYVRDITPHIEFEYFPVVFQELFLRSDFASSEFMLKVVFHFLVLLRHPLGVGLYVPVVVGHDLAKRLGLLVNLEEFSSVGVAVKQSDVFAVDCDFISNSEAKRRNKLA